MSAPSPWPAEALARSEELRQLLEESESGVLPVRIPPRERTTKMEAKLFTQDRAGIAVHWTVEHEDVDGLTVAVDRLLTWLDAGGFEAHVGFDNGRRNTPVARQESAEPSAPEVRCGRCNGPVYDNNAGKGKTNPRGPDWTCKDKENCGGRAWKSKDGSPGPWKEPLV